MVEVISIYESIGRNLKDILAKGVPTNSTGTAVESDVLVQQTTDQLKGSDLYFYEGQGAGQDRIVTSFTPGSNMAFTERAFATVPTADSKFIIFKRFRADDYENALNRAMNLARTKHLDESVATMDIVATQYEYAVPSGFEYISTIRLVPTASKSSDYKSDDEVDRQYEFPPHLWHIEANPLGSYIIAFDSRKINLSNFDNQSVRVLGQVKPTLTATTLSEDVQEYVIAYASAVLASTLIDDKQEWKTRFYLWRDAARDLENYLVPYHHGKRVGG